MTAGRSAPWRWPSARRFRVRPFPASCRAIRAFPEATRARVLAAADELGYQPNLIARGLKNQSTGIVGVVVTDLDNSYHAHALQLLIEKMGEKRLAPLVFAGNSSKAPKAPLHA
ncbi:MAG: hypothetical protein R3D70_19400 [Rhizobiaceae bacterium]